MDRDNSRHNSNYVRFDGKEYKKCDEISLTSNDELLEEFKQIIKPLYEKDNLEKHIKTRKFSNFKMYHTNDPDDSQIVFRFQRFAGDGHRGISKDYYTLVPKKYINNSIGTFGKLKDMEFIYNNGVNKKFLEYYFTFDNITDANNFKNYLLSDFVRACLYLEKTNIELIGGKPTKDIPWFDFSYSVFSKSPAEIDDYLFKKYNISDEIRQHIEELLPDYYNIRKKKVD